MPFPSVRLVGLSLCLFVSGGFAADVPAAAKLLPNLTETIEQPLRYRPDGADFVIENGQEFFNRSLYGGNTAFRVDGGDKPEFLLYLPGRGGNLRIGLYSPAGAKWIHQADEIVTRYRPGELIYDIRDPLLGAEGRVRLTVVAYHQTEGLVVQVEAKAISPGLEWIWAYGGINGQRGRRDGDIGTETLPISQYFQLRPEFCRDNIFTLQDESFTVVAKAATLAGRGPKGSHLLVADARDWNTPATLFAPRPDGKIEQPIVVGRAPLVSDTPLLLSLQRIATNAPAAEDLETYKEVSKERPGAARAIPTLPLAERYSEADLPQRFAEARQHFAELRNRVGVDTPDPFFNAAVGALNVAADAVWDEPQHAIMHGAIAWRTKLLGWRGPYCLDALGWHDRARQNIDYWASRQNTDTIPDHIPPADEGSNLARNENGLHSNGDISNSHYDMNLVFIDGVFRHLRWTGDLELAKKLWPVIERHLAWERRLFRREFGPDKLPLYEAYAVIWASDDLQYSGGGAMHASAYNFFHNREAARLARLLGADPTPYEREAELLGRGMRAHLWLADRGWFAEYKDYLGLQRVHPSAALWTFYHTVDSEVPTPEEAWRMTQQVETEIPHLPVRGPGVPPDLYTLATSDWMPYQWSINNVVMAEAIHAALGFWQAGRPEEAWRITEGSLLAAMFMGISPGNVGSTSYLDVYRRESQRDFADGSGVLSRAVVEGLFGVRPDVLAGELTLAPGFPSTWDHAALRHPDLTFEYRRNGDTDRYVVKQAFTRPLALRLRVRAPRDHVASVKIDGQKAEWKGVTDSVGGPRIEIVATPGIAQTIEIKWAGGEVVLPGKELKTLSLGERVQGQMRWHALPRARRMTAPTPASIDYANTIRFDPVDLTAVFNDRVTQIFKNEYRSPRSPFVSLALPKQGLGGWAGGVNATADIDDTGLRARAARQHGQIVLPNSVPLVTPGQPEARNVLFVSQWDNYSHEATVPLSGRAKGIVMLMAGSTGPMQSRFENGEVIVTYDDDSFEKLALENPTNWWPIEQDYFIDDYQFNRPGPLPVRVDLKTGEVRVLDPVKFKGQGRAVPGGAATVVEFSLQSGKPLKSLTVRALANDVVIGLMSATLVR